MSYRRTLAFDVLRTIDELGPHVRNIAIQQHLAVESYNSINSSITGLINNGYLECEGRHRPFTEARANERRLIITDMGHALLQNRLPSRPEMKHQGEAKHRPCLGCGNQRFSEGYGDRICPDCKGSVEWCSPAAAAHVTQETG